MSTSNEKAIKEVKSNKARKKIIKTAKKFVENFGLYVTFSEEGNKVVATVNEGYITKTAVAECNKVDTFNLNIGKAIALCRLKGLDAKIFTEAPQPNENAVGQIITFPKDDKEYHRKVVYQVDSVDTGEWNLTILKDELASIFGDEPLTGTKANADLKEEHDLVTIDDTNAQY